MSARADSLEVAQVIVWSWLSFLCVLWTLKMQRDQAHAEIQRRKRQRLQRLGLAPIPGADGPARSEDD